MNITINGDVYISNYGELLDLVGSDYDEDFDELDLGEDEFEDDCEYCDGTCEDCEFNEGELDPVEELIDDYVELLTEGCICPECVRELLEEFTLEFLDIIIEE